MLCYNQQARGIPTHAHTCVDTADLHGMQAPFVVNSINKQLLDEVEHDIMNYQNRGLCYLPKPDTDRHEVLIIHDIMRKPDSIIVLLYIFHIIHPQKQRRSVQPFCF